MLLLNTIKHYYQLEAFAAKKNNTQNKKSVTKKLSEIKEIFCGKSIDGYLIFFSLIYELKVKKDWL